MSNDTVNHSAQAVTTIGGGIEAGDTYVSTRAVTGGSVTEGSRITGTGGTLPRRPATPSEARLPVRSKDLEELCEEVYGLALQVEATSSPTERYLLVEKLLEFVEAAFRLRPDRDRPFMKMVLLLQGSLLHLPAETLTFEQMAAVREVAGLLRTPRLTDLDLRDARRTLLQSGLDPSRPSGGLFTEGADE